MIARLAAKRTTAQPAEARSTKGMPEHERRPRSSNNASHHWALSPSTHIRSRVGQPPGRTRAGFQDLQPRQVRRVGLAGAFAAQARRSGLAA